MTLDYKHHNNQHIFKIYENDDILDTIKKIIAKNIYDKLTIEHDPYNHFFRIFATIKKINTLSG